jgi:hypothetical protein
MSIENLKTFGKPLPPLPQPATLKYFSWESVIGRKTAFFFFFFLSLRACGIDLQMNAGFCLIVNSRDFRGPLVAG